MKKLFLLLIAGLLSLASFSQIATIKWYYTDGAHTYNKQETFDIQYGRLDRGVVAPRKLALLKDGQYLIGQEALNELNKPVWGTNHNKTFVSILPVVSKVEPEYITVSNWRTYPDEVPIDQDGVYNLRIELGAGKYKTFPNGEFNAYWWGILSPLQWKPVGEPSSREEPNPAYPAYQQKLTEYENILGQTFTQMGTYIFPSFKLIDGVVWMIKYENETEWVEVPVDPNNPLASFTGGWIFKLLPVRDFEIRPWSTYVPSTILSPPETRVRLLLRM